MKNYLFVIVTKHDGTTFHNPLKLSEAYLISTLARENKSVLIKFLQCTKAEYKSIFG
jgi:hypothetical protein